MANRQWKTGKGAPLSFSEWMSGYVECPSEERADSEAEQALNQERAADVSAKVRRALEMLTESERLVVEAYHFMGRSPAEIAEEMSLSPRAFERVLRSAQVKMRNLLSEFVIERFGYAITKKCSCPICDSPYRLQAEKVIAGKLEQETWKRIIRQLRERCAIRIATPQTLIGHQKYHLLQK